MLIPITMWIREFLNEFLPLRDMGHFTNFADNFANKLVTNSYEFFWAMGCLTGNKQLDFGADTDHDLDPGIYFYHLRDMDNFPVVRVHVHGLLGWKNRPDQFSYVV